jgi:hypothetical protein
LWKLLHDKEISEIKIDSVPKNTKDLCNKYDRTIVDQELRDPVSILCKSLNVQNLRDFDLINK